MDIELRNLHVNTTDNRFFFDADLWIDGKNAGYVTYLEGASMTIRETTDVGLHLIEAAKEFCERLPPMQLNSEKGKPVRVVMDLEKYIFRMVAAQQAKMDERKDGRRDKKKTPRKGRRR